MKGESGEGNDVNPGGERNFTLGELAAKLDRPVRGDTSTRIRAVAPLEQAGPGDITYADGRWLKRLSQCAASAVVVREDPGIPGLNCIIHEFPALAFVALLNIFHPRNIRFTGVSSRAEVDESATLGEPLTVAAFASIGAGSVVGPRCFVAAGARIGESAVIGADCVIHPNVVIGDCCVIGDRVIIHAGTVIGADGFGYLQHEGRHVKVPQVGAVRIGNDVEIGANCCIDRGTLGDTVIGNGVKIDNLVQVAHNVVVGDLAIIVAQVGIAGSATIGPGAILAGNVGVIEHVSVGAGAMVSAKSLVTKDVKPGTANAGIPAGDLDEWHKSTVILRNLPKHWRKLLEILRERGD
jgi:UDP-3-O-[3-hydroxymyristoyl] glucosamine N-acyltransferase